MGLNLQPIEDFTVTSTITPVQSGPGSDGNAEVLYIPERSKTDALPSDGLALNPGHLLGRGLTPCRDAVGVFYTYSRMYDDF